MGTRYVWDKFSIETAESVEETLHDDLSIYGDYLDTSMEGLLVTQNVEFQNGELSGIGYSYEFDLQQVLAEAAEGLAKGVLVGYIPDHSVIWTKGHPGKIAFKANPELGSVSGQQGYQSEHWLLSYDAKKRRYEIWIEARNYNHILGNYTIIDKPINGILRLEYRKTVSKGSTAYGYASHANADEYPDDNYSEDYWYTYLGADEVDPVKVTTTDAEGGDAVTITVVPRSNVYGGTIQYQYEYSVDGGNTWVSIKKTTDTSVSLTIPDGAETLQARVRASDDMGFVSRDYIHADSYTIKNSAGVAAIDGAIRKFDIVVCVNGAVKTDIDVYCGDNAVTKVN